MKRFFLNTIGFAALLLISYSGKTQCLNTNGNMETITAPAVAGNSWINNNLTNWSVSHGSPSINTVPNNYMWMWSYQNTNPVARGEGIFTNYSFVTGQTYQLTYSLWLEPLSNPISQFRAELTTGLIPAASTSSTIPTPATQQSLTTQNWATATLGSWQTVTETFIADANYTQLWLYPRLNGNSTPEQAECKVDNICITRVTPGPCGFTPQFEETYLKCNIQFENTTLVPLGFTVLKTTWDFGDGNTATGNTVDHFFATSDLYTVCMTVWMIDGNGTCCQQTVCRIIRTETCDPCGWVDEAKIAFTGSNPFEFEVTGLAVDMYDVMAFHWDFGDGTYGTGVNPSHTYMTGGLYIVSLTVYYYDPIKRECCNATIYKKMWANDIEIGEEGRAPIVTDEENKNEAFAPKVTVYPNPSDGKFNLQLNGDATIKTVTVYDQAGKNCYSVNNNSDTKNFTLDLNKLEKGLYTIIINENDELTRAFEKIILQ